ncbi:hypothetical protein K435DRAFT_837278 [Dendrothele bispora CBS 962.96]|uniref:Uncharacterized protein n=1 Tax=Dendrothele bispora (strain CBS 962.96) TaxID=1314807 RepID=A0A4S8MDM6_DENBC|nr:hypothetical protein K435DRAFT_837278 [Dendrothele bispora CBS 962.96]
MSNSLSEENDQEIAEEIGSLFHLIGQLVVMMAVIFMVYGIYLAVTLLAMQVLISRGIRNSKPRLALFVIAVFELLISTTYAILLLVFNAFIFLASDDPNSKWLQHYEILSTQFGIGIDFVVRLNFLLSDGIVVWRTWVLFPFNKLVKVALVFCMLVATVCTFVDAGLNARSSLRDIEDDSGGPASQTLLMALPLLITNVVATSLIGYKTWCHRQDVKQNLMSTGTAMSRVSKILWLLIESGLIYCIIWIAFIIVTQTGPNPNDATASLSAQVFTGITPLLAAIFPVLVILMAALEDAKDSESDLSDSNNHKPSNPNPNSKNNKNVSRSLSHSMRFASRSSRQNSASTTTSAIYSFAATPRSESFLEADLRNRGMTFMPLLSRSDGNMEQIDEEQLETESLKDLDARDSAKKMSFDV